MKKYCVTAVNRESEIRRTITGPMSEGQAKREKKQMMMQAMKKYYKYFHVARYPYKPRQMGKRYK